MKIDHIQDGLYNVVYEILLCTKKKPDISMIYLPSGQDNILVYDDVLDTSTPDAPVDLYVCSGEHGMVNVKIGRWPTRNLLHYNKTLPKYLEKYEKIDMYVDVDEKMYKEEPRIMKFLDNDDRKILNYSRGRPLFPITIEASLQGTDFLDQKAYTIISEAQDVARSFLKACDGLMYDSTQWTDRKFDKQLLLACAAHNIEIFIRAEEIVRQKKQIEKMRIKKKLTLL